MNFPESSSRVLPIKHTYACTRCSLRKVKCNRQAPCESCTRHNVECIFRPPKPSRRRREPIIDKSVDERLKRYEALLRQKGINPDQVEVASEITKHRQSPRQHSVGESDVDWKLPIETLSFKPLLRQGQDGTELVDK